MSTASGDRLWRAHLLMPAVAVYTSITALTVVTSGPHIRLVYGVSTVVYVLILSSAMKHLQHDGMCVRCAEAVPLDPQRAVRRWIWALRVAHYSRRQAWTVCFLAWVALIVGSFFPVGSVLHIVLGLPIVLLLVFSAVAVWQHHRLQPWCPWCRGGWDDDGDPEVVPDPTPGNTRSA